MEVVSTRKTGNHLLSNSVYLLIPVVLYTYGEIGQLLAIPALICVIVFGMGSRFVTVLRISGNQLEIDYTKFFRRHTASFNIADTVLEIRRYEELRSYGRLPIRPVKTYDWLHVIVSGKEKFYVDGRKGFSTPQLLTFLQAFAEAKTKTGDVLIYKG